MTISRQEYKKRRFILNSIIQIVVLLYLTVPVIALFGIGKLIGGML